MAERTRRAINRVIKRVGPDHPITVEPAGSRIVVRAGDELVADTTDALVLHEAALPPVFYLPISAVNAGLLRRSTTSTYCPYKGDASYYSLSTDAGLIPDAAWWYPQPYPDVAAIASHLAFYPNRVTISEAKRVAG